MKKYKRMCSGLPKGYTYKIIPQGVSFTMDRWRYSYSIRKDTVAKPKRHFVWGFKSKEEAAAALNKFVEDNQESILLTKNPKSTVGRALDDFLNYERNRFEITSYDIEYSTLHKYIYNDYYKMHIEKFFTPSTYMPLKKKIMESPLREGSKNKIFSYMRSWAKYCSLVNLIKGEVLNRFLLEYKSIKDPNKHSKKDTIFCELDLMNNWLNKIKDEGTWWYVFFRLQVEVGARISELRGLQVKHFDPVNQTLKIEQQAIKSASYGHTIIKKPKTLNSYRVIKISNDLTNILKEYLETYRISDPNKFLFFGKDKPIGENTIHRALKYYLEAYNMPKGITIHRMRSFAITYLLDREGLSPRSIASCARRFGNSESVAINSYLNVSGKEDNDMADFFDSHLKEKNNYGRH